MGKRTGIGWTQSSWNPWHGCTKVSPGCARCYMYAEKTRYGQDPTVVVHAKTTFNDPLRWRAPRTIFTCSWSDFFHGAADGWRPEAWRIMQRADWHRYLLLTKRPERIRDHLPAGWPWPHVWLGVSVESEAYLWRVEALRQVPAAGRFISAEPLLGPLPSLDLTGIGWVIIGGESGPGHRPLPLDGLTAIVARCQAAGVPVFVKQASGPRPGRQGPIPDALWQLKELPHA
jgi:protein gp37